MSLRRIALSLLLCCLAAGTSRAALEPVVNVTGRVSVSVDGGPDSVEGATIDVDKPAGATVRAAYLAVASQGFTETTGLSNTGFLLAGTAVTFSSTVPSALGGGKNQFADVTSIVKPILDAAATGRSSLVYRRTEAPTLDGIALAVIFDDPNQSHSNTVLILFGAQAIAGDTFTINLGDPIDLENPNQTLTFGLGIGFSFQPGGQVSRIDVNDQRLTSSAGGQDDQGQTFSLITVGGLDDSTGNPDPLAAADSIRTDDELYDLRPFVGQGDTSIDVFTTNPSNDDNIFFAYLVLGDTTAVIGEGIVLTPPEATLPAGGQHTVTAHVQDDNGAPIPGRVVSFNVVSGPNAGFASGMATTGSNGEATFTYAGSHGGGTDSIVATTPATGSGTLTSNAVSVTWTGAPVFETVIYPVSDWGESFDYADGQGSEGQQVTGFFAAQTEGVHILDITDPSAISLLSQYAPRTCLNGSKRVTFSADDVVYVPQQGAIHVAVGRCGVHIVDADRESPTFGQLLGRYDTPQWAEAVAVFPCVLGDVDRLCSAEADYSSLRIFDVTDPAHVVFLSSIDTPSGGIGPGPIVNVDIWQEESGTFAAVATGDGARIMNVTNPSAPVVVGTYLTPAALGPNSISQDIAVDPALGRIYLPSWAGGLQVLGLATSNPIEQLASLPTDSAYFTAVPCNGHLCAAEGTEGLRVLDLETETNELVPVQGSGDPIAVGDPGDWAWDLKIRGCFAFVTFGNLDTGAGGLQVSQIQGCGDPEPFVLNLLADSDGDGVPDVRDDCTDVPDPAQADVDLDGYGNACDADYDENGTVGIGDFSIFAAAFGASAGDPRYDARADHDGDGAVGVKDYLVLSGSWGRAPGPSGLH